MIGTAMSRRHVGTGATYGNYTYERVDCCARQLHTTRIGMTLSRAPRARRRQPHTRTSHSPASRRPPLRHRASAVCFRSTNYHMSSSVPPRRTTAMASPEVPRRFGPKCNMRHSARPTEYSSNAPNTAASWRLVSLTTPPLAGITHATFAGRLKRQLSLRAAHASDPCPQPSKTTLTRTLCSQANEPACYVLETNCGSKAPTHKSSSRGDHARRSIFRGSKKGSGNGWALNRFRGQISKNTCGLKPCKAKGSRKAGP